VHAPKKHVARKLIFRGFPHPAPGKGLPGYVSSTNQRLRWRMLEMTLSGALQKIVKRPNPLIKKAETFSGLGLVTRAVS